MKSIMAETFIDCPLEITQKNTGAYKLLARASGMSYKQMEISHKHQCINLWQIRTAKVLRIHKLQFDKKVSQNIFHHSFNKRRSKFIKTDRHLRLSKLIKMIDDDPPHVSISAHHLGQFTAPYN